MNEYENIAYQNLWTTAKTVLRGKFIVLNTYIWIKERSQIKNPRRIGQDGRVERPSAHFLSQAHQNHNHLQKNQSMKKTGTYQKRFSTT